MSATRVYHATRRPAATSPLAARAQQPTATTHRLGLLFASSEPRAGLPQGLRKD